MNTYFTHLPNPHRMCEQVKQICVSMDQRTGTLLGVLSVGSEHIASSVWHSCTSLAESIAETASKAGSFIADNWHKLLAYLSAWGVILACTGLMYGFQAVAFPLSIGIACGFAFGVITGIFTVKVFDQNNDYCGRNTLWDILNQGIENLDPNGTRQIVLAVAVTVVLAASVVFPYVIGSIFGVFIGNQLATKAGYGVNLGSDPKKVDSSTEELKSQVQKLHNQLDELESELERLQAKATSDSSPSET